MKRKDCVVDLKLILLTHKNMDYYILDLNVASSATTAWSKERHLRMSRYKVHVCVCGF